jgi:hypothetical protein
MQRGTRQHQAVPPRRRASRPCRQESYLGTPPNGGAPPEPAGARKPAEGRRFGSTISHCGAAAQSPHSLRQLAAAMAPCALMITLRQRGKQ